VGSRIVLVFDVDYLLLNGQRCTELQRSLQQSGVQIRPVEVPERRSTLFLVRVKVHVANLVPLPAQHIAQPGQGGMLRKVILKTP